MPPTRCKARSTRVSVVVGVNRYRHEDNPSGYDVFRHDPRTTQLALDRLRELREKRDPTNAKSAIQAIREAAEQRQPLMPRYIEAAKADVTLGEMVTAVESVLGRFRYRPIVARPETR